MLPHPIKNKNRLCYLIPIARTCQEIGKVTTLSLFSQIIFVHCLTNPFLVPNSKNYHSRFWHSEAHLSMSGMGGLPSSLVSATRVIFTRAHSRKKFCNKKQAFLIGQFQVVPLCFGPFLFFPHVVPSEYDPVWYPFGLTVGLLSRWSGWLSGSSSCQWAWSSCWTGGWSASGPYLRSETSLLQLLWPAGPFSAPCTRTITLLEKPFINTKKIVITSEMDSWIIRVSSIMSFFTQQTLSCSILPNIHTYDMISEKGMKALSHDIWRGYVLLQ